MGPKRVLHVVSKMHRGGAETMIMNLYRNIDREKLQFDFLSHTDEDSDYDEEIRNLGGKVIKIPSLGTSGPIKYIKNLKAVMKVAGPYEAVHSHTNRQSGFVHIASYLAGIRKRITHSHTTKWKKRYFIYRVLINIFSNKWCACGEVAGISIFGKNKKNEIVVLNNGIDIEKFLNHDFKNLKEIKGSLNIPNEKIILGHVGRLSEEKNHKFIIEIAEEMKKLTTNFIFLFIGDGPLKEEILKKIKEKKLEEHIKYLGVKENINDYMAIFDIFLLPSFNEGFPVVLVEAQAANKKCLISDTVPLEVDLGMNLIKRLGIKENKVKDWIKEIMEHEESKVKKSIIKKRLKDEGFCAKNNVIKLYKIYGI